MKYTREQILSMAGDELNHTVAAVVNRWGLKSDDLGLIWWVDSDGVKRVQEYEYSPATDISDAWKIVKKLSETYGVEVYEDSGAPCECKLHLWSVEPSYVVEADTVPEAITKAAILAMMND